MRMTNEEVLAKCKFPDCFHCIFEDCLIRYGMTFKNELKVADYAAGFIESDTAAGLKLSDLKKRTYGYLKERQVQKDNRKAAKENDMTSMTSYKVDDYVNCPFYAREDGLSIKCTGVCMEATHSIQVFQNKTAKENYKSDFCCSLYTGCPVYIAINENID